MLHDFDILRPDVNGHSFVEKWPDFSFQLRDIFNAQYPKQIFASLWPPEVKYLLILLKLLPYKSTGRPGVPRAESFKKSQDRLIIFCKVYSEKNISVNRSR